jgi:hypothetical protein
VQRPEDAGQKTEDRERRTACRVGSQPTRDLPFETTKFTLAPSEVERKGPKESTKNLNRGGTRMNADKNGMGSHRDTKITKKSAPEWG